MSKKPWEYTEEEIKESFRQTDNKTLTAFYNILVMSSVCLMSADDRRLNDRQFTCLCAVLDERNISYTKGKRI